MSIQINSLRVAAPRMLAVALFLPEERHNEAIALDGLRVIFQTLAESTARLERKLLDVVANAKPMTYGDSIFYEAQVTYTSVMSEIWIVVDNIYRASLFLNLIPEISNSVAGLAYNQINSEVKGLRDSLHHINERIQKYFARIGGSILGDIIWRSRSSVGEKEISHFLFSGVHRNEGKTIHIGQIEPVEFVNNLGLYDLRIQYVKKQNRNASEEPTEVNLSNAIGSVNTIIDSIISFYEQFLLTKEGAPFDNIAPGLTAAMVSG